MIWNIAKMVLGFVSPVQSGSSVGNKVSGGINYSIMLAVASWVWMNKADSLVFQIIFNYKGKLETFTLFSTTVGGLGLVAGCVFVYMEYMRRSVSGLRVNPFAGNVGISPGP